MKTTGVDIEEIFTGLDRIRLQYGLPVWHAEAHDPKCRIQFALRYLLGVGKTDGESTERLWSLLNPASWSTKEMGEGARHDVLEDKIDLINFEKNRSMGRTLARRLIVAVAERQRQGIEFQELDDSVPKKKRREWAKMMDAWYKDNTQTNPFEVQGGKLAGPSERNK
ncbi:CxC2 domain-containing protein [Mycena indigotica]|uniref:CxC2 domain-containing protein n=1 Tax=Mycena indigotica TaxID=2126181 RepID=A0A8H6S665_9AGAR|nr:CxC2 domain-containing protein [Mycena indigotica]KAF7292950.1 CxC2 domain-containing protein [Mycena indigotica]